MPPKRKSPAAGSPRKTRSMAAGKQRAEAPVKAAKKEAPEQKGRKRAKKEDAEVAEMASDGKRIVVEACTQCRQFKIRAVKVKEDLESSVPGVSVVINPEKPRRGCLEIREEGGEVFISLLNMPRPFTAMKKLDMDEVIKDIANKIS
uniref:Selenoprotein H n=1 Tax=Oryza punctata TaxID=4537 RepID=A0A0E0MID2_ORYPU